MKKLVSLITALVFVLLLCPFMTVSYSEESVLVYARKYQLVGQYYGTNLMPVKKDLKLKTIDGNNKSDHLKAGRFQNRAIAVTYSDYSESTTWARATWVDPMFEYESLQDALDYCLIYFDHQLMISDSEVASYVTYRFWDTKASREAYRDITIEIGGISITVAHLYETQLIETIDGNQEYTLVPVYGIIMGKSTKTPTPTKKPTPTNTPEPGPDPTPTPEPGPDPTPTPEPTPTPDPEPTPTPDPEPTPTPAPTPTPEPENTPDPQHDPIVLPPWNEEPVNEPDPQHDPIVLPFTVASAPEAPVVEVVSAVEAPVVEVVSAPEVESPSTSDSSSPDVQHDQITLPW